MDYRKSLLAALVAPLLLLGSGHISTAHGAGFGVFTQGASPLGQGNAVTAHTDSPSTIFYNPALMNKLDGTQVEFGTTAIYSTHEYDGFSGSHAFNEKVFFPSTFYVTHKFTDVVSAGFGIFNPFGLATNWGRSWEGRYQATKSQLTTFNFNPVMSFQILPQLSFAAGVDVINAHATLERQIPVGPLGDVNLRFKGNGTGVGVNVAAAYNFTKDLTLGVSYRSPVRIDLDGKANTTLPVVPETKGWSSVKLPAQVTAGLAYQVSDPLMLEAGIRWEQWSAFRELKIEVETGGITVTRRNWHDTLGMNVGGKYKLNDTVSLSGGYIYGSNAVPSYTFDPSIPDSDTHIFCVGSGFDFKPLKLDVSYAYQYYTSRTKNNTIAGLPGPFEANGEYNSDAHLLAISLGYKF